MEYLKANRERLLKAASAPVDVYKQGLAAEEEGVPNPAPLVEDMQRALAQARETMRRLKAGEDPYAGRVGDFAAGLAVGGLRRIAGSTALKFRRATRRRRRCRSF